MARISVVDPVGRAWDRMLLICFRPFNFTRWLLLGFCAWLAYLGEGGANGNFRFPGGGGGGGGRGGGGGSPIPIERENPFRDALGWLNEHVVLVTVLAGVGIVLGVAVYLLLQWLRARGEFMFVDGIATNRQDDLVARPWKQYARQANSFFVYQAAMGLANILLALLIGALCLAIAWPDLIAWQLGTRAIQAIVTAALVYPLAMLTLGLFIACNRLFVLPIMYARGTLFAPAWCEFWKTIVPGHVGSLLLFFILYALFNLAFVLASILSFCFTCCLAALPYVGTVVLLPALVFLRCYSICYLEQFGPAYTILSAELPGRGFEVILPPDTPNPPPAPPPPAPPAPPEPPAV